MVAPWDFEGLEPSETGPFTRSIWSTPSAEIRVDGGHLLGANPGPTREVPRGAVATIRRPKSPSKRYPSATIQVVSGLEIPS